MHEASTNEVMSRRQALAWATIGSVVAVLAQTHPPPRELHAGPISTVLAAGGTWIGVAACLGAFFHWGAADDGPGWLECSVFVAAFTAGVAGLLWLARRPTDPHATLSIAFTTVALLTPYISLVAAAITSSFHMLRHGRTVQRLAVVLMLCSVVGWFWLTDRVTGDASGPFAWAGFACALLFSFGGICLGLVLDGFVISHQPRMERRFWALFSMMIGGIIGLVAFSFWYQYVVHS